MGRLEGKVALVTGAAKGNGLSIAEIFAREGAKVACADLDGTLAKVAAQQAGNGSIGVQGDVSKQQDAERMVAETVAGLGGLDILVNNAGILTLGGLTDLTVEDWDRQQAVNVRGPFLMTKAALPHLAKKGGSVIMIASLTGLKGIKGSVAYSSSKHAVIGMTRSLALDLGPQNIRVNAICPGIIDTGMAEQLRAQRRANLSYDQFLKEVGGLYPMGRLGKPEDMAYAALHFASDESARATGTIHSIDGGAMLL